MPLSLRHLSPLRIIIGNEDVTQYVDDGLTFSNVDPGGFEACSMQFPRDMPTVLRGQNIRIDSGLRVAWEGRVAQVQRSLGHRTTIMGEGYGALLKDQTASMVFVDRDLTRWQAPSYQRQINLLAGNLALQTTQVAADPTSDLPALVQTINGAWASPFKPQGEAWYDSGPQNLIASIYYDLIASTLANASDFLLLSSDDIATTSETSANLYSTTDNTGYYTPATAYRFAIVQFANTATPGGASGAQYNANWKKLAAYGNHGLPLRGTDPAGFYPSDIAGWTEQQCPGINPGVIQTTDASGYIVPHSAYYVPVALDNILNDMAIVQGWHWGVWDGLSPLTGDPTPRLDFRPRPAPGAFTSFCRRGDCDTLDLREDLEQQFNQAVVNYTSVAGRPGAAIVTTDNPILDQAGIPSRTVVLSGGTMTQATASLFGAEALAILNAQNRVAGSANIIAPIDTGIGYAPAWLLKAGLDRLRISDVPSADAFGATSDFPITRVEATVSTGGMTANIELGSGNSLIETVQSRLAASTALAGQGG